MSLVRRPLRGKPAAGGTPMRSGEEELTALQQAPGDQQKAVALAKVLLDRAAADDEFDQALQRWWQQAESVRAGIGNVTNTISGGTQQGPVLQGRDFSGITFGTATVTPPAPPPPTPDVPA
jgi:hypothetical protein